MVIYPYLTGQELNIHPKHEPSQWIINFHDWPLEKAQNYTDPMKIIKERVYPERMSDTKSRKIYEKIWWQFWGPRKELYSNWMIWPGY